VKVIKAPDDWSESPGPHVFAGGSIGMGLADDWQSAFADLLVDVPGTLVNPRREHWDSSWPNIPTCEPLKEQILWELEARESCDLLVFYFDPLTKSPITLLELGLSAEIGKVLVCCPPSFWRYANVAITCDYYSIPMAPDLEALATLTRGVLGRHINSV
jgi:hypothetical protein